MMPASAWALYCGAVLIWGSTWLVITFQLGQVAPEASVIYRFALASILLFAYSHIKSLPLRFSRSEHFLLLTQGAFLFSLNYILFYHAELHIASGLVALICSGLAFINILGMRVFFAQSFSARVALGSLLGICGIAMVFWPEVERFGVERQGWLGVGLACIATVSASAGNLISVAQRKRQMPLIPAMAYAMAYGVLWSLMYSLAIGAQFSFDWHLRYVASLLYLVVFGSIAAFLCYLTLIARVGADKAAYVNVTVPVMALMLSSLVEGFHWQILTFVGVSLSLAGNLLVMSAKRRQS